MSLYCFVAYAATANKGFGGSHLTKVSEFASLTWIIDDSVPLMLRLERSGVLLCLIKENTFFTCINVREYITNTTQVTLGKSLKGKELSMISNKPRLHSSYSTQLYLLPLYLTNPANIMSGLGECMLIGSCMYTSLRDLKDFWCTKLTPVA